MEEKLLNVYTSMSSTYKTCKTPQEDGGTQGKELERSTSHHPKETTFYAKGLAGSRVIREKAQGAEERE